MAESIPATGENAGGGGQKKRRFGSLLIPPVLRPGNYLLMKLQGLLNSAFGHQLNPMYYLGAITFFNLWLITGTGLYLYLFYEMDAKGAYDSVNSLSTSQPYLGGIMRSVHRYASAGLAISILLHIFQVFFSDRFRKNRWVAWVTGAAILPIAWFEGLSGYILPWDERARQLAIFTAEWVDFAGITVEPLARYFTAGMELVPPFFFVMTYLHMTVPVLILIIAWIHCMRITMPVINPPGNVSLWIAGSILAVSIFRPATSLGPPDTTKLVGKIELDWFYLWPYPLVDYLGLTPGMVWGLTIPLITLFVSMPWVIRGPKQPSPPENRLGGGEEDSGFVGRRSFASGPKIDLEKCTGCMLCQQACPFEAVRVLTKPAGSAHEREAAFEFGRCADCGFCLAACEFGAVKIDGIGQDWLDTKIRTAIGDASNKIAVLICARSAGPEDFYGFDGTSLPGIPQAAAVFVPCSGVVTKQAIDRALQTGAIGVAVVSCPPMDCHYREARRRLKFQPGAGGPFPAVYAGDDPRVSLIVGSRSNLDAMLAQIGEFARNAASLSTPDGANRDETR